MARYFPGSALTHAASVGDLASVQLLISEGADVKAQYRSVLLVAARGCVSFRTGAPFGLPIPLRSHLVLMQWLLEMDGASISDSNDDGETAWSMLSVVGADAAELSSLLKVMVMLAVAPANFVARLSPQHAKLATRGQHFRAQLPAYLEQQRASIISHCPLPAALQPLVAAYAATTPEDMWTDSLL